MNAKVITNVLLVFMIMGSLSGCIKVEIVSPNEVEEPKVEVLAPMATVTTLAVLAPEFDCNNVTEIPADECEALVSLYAHTNWDGWILHDGWLTTDTPCSWYGVICNSGHVSSLNLPNNRLTGNIPPKIGNLVSLVNLDLSNNKLSGNIPVKIGNLANLANLNLSNNGLSGNIPPEIGKLANLVVLNLSNNGLSGNIPPELGDLAKLVNLDLSNSGLSVSIPTMAPAPTIAANPVPITAAVEYSTFLGGNGNAVIYSVAVCLDGSIVVGGSTGASNLPVTPGAFDTTYDYTVPSDDYMNLDGFVAKFDAAGALKFLTYLGGSSSDTISSVAVDEQCSIYLTGHTFSDNFPTTENAYDRTFQGDGRDTIVTKLSSDGSTLLYSTYLGGTGWDYGNIIAVDNAHNAYIGGFTHGGYPVTAGAAAVDLGGPGDGFVAKLDVDGSQLVYATYIGRDDDWDGVNSMAVDHLGAVYVPIGIQSNDGAGVTKISPDGSRFEYSTPLPGYSFGLTVDSQRNVYVVGHVLADSDTYFPVTADAFQSTYGGGKRDVTIAKLDQSGVLIYGSYFGGNGLDTPGNSNNRWAVDSAGNIYFTGSTSSTNFPLAQPFQSALGGSYDAFVVIFNVATGPVLSSYLGGSANESSYGDDQNFYSTAIAVDNSGNIYLAGRTDSADFPTTPNAFDKTFNGPTYDGFLTKISGR